MKPEGYNSMRCQILHRLGMGMPCCDINIQITQSSRTRTMHYVSLLGNQRIHTRSRNQLYELSVWHWQRFYRLHRVDTAINSGCENVF